jgi:apolipoprotein N-acyltransferase
MEGNSILSGSFENRALKYSFFSTFTNYQPWGAILYSLSAKTLAGGDILGARFLSVFLALVLVLLVYFELFRRKLGWVGFCAALTILLAPQNTIHFRWVYPHFFVSLGVVLIGLLLSRD